MNIGQRTSIERLLLVVLILAWFAREQYSALRRANGAVPVMDEDMNAPHCFQIPRSNQNNADNILGRYNNTDFRSRNLIKIQDNILQVFDEALPTYDEAGGRLSKPLVMTNILRRTQLKVLQSDNIVLVTQMGVTRVSTLMIQLVHWKGPSSVAVYINERKSIEDFFQFFQEHSAELSTVTFHLVMEKPHISPEAGLPAYPHNILRNVALETVECDFVFLLDVDFIPIPNAYQTLSNWIRSRDMDLKENLRHRRMLYVVPAFELLPPNNESFYADPGMLPQSKQELLHLYHNRSLLPFKKEWIQGHRATGFATWFRYAEASSASSISSSNRSDYYYPLKFIGRDREFFEPYIVAYRPLLPRYWEAFRGFGQNKVSFFKELLRPKYKIAWSAFKDLYCVHLDHPKVKNKQEKEISNTPIRKDFRKYLDAKYPDSDDENVAVATAKAKYDPSPTSSVI